MTFWGKNFQKKKKVKGFSKKILKELLPKFLIIVVSMSI